MNNRMNSELTSRTVRDWGHLDQSFVGKVVNIVKHIGRWERDGPSLRVLNKHWCAQLSRFVARAHPHDSRVMNPLDITSLLKFSNLESVDFWSFLMAQLSVSATSDQCDELWALLGHAERKECLMQLVDVLSRIPSLREIRLRIDMLHKLDYLLKDNDLISNINRLKGVTSLQLVQPTGSEVFFMSDLMFLAGLPIRNISGTVCIESCDDLHHFPQLERVGISLWMDYSPELQYLLGRFKEISLEAHRIPEEDLPLDQVSRLKTLKALKMNPVTCRDLHRLADMIHLKNLSLVKVEDQKGIGRVALSLVSGLNLETLKINGHFAEPLAIPDEFFEAVSSLKCLSLDSVQLNAAAILRNLNRLKLLELKTSTVTDEMEFWKYVDMPDCIEGQTLHRIVVLDLIDVWDDCVLEFVSGMKSLEAFGFAKWPSFSLTKFQELEKSSTLRKLSIRCFNIKTIVTDLQSLGFITRLDKLCVNGIVSAEILEKLEELSNKWRHHSPWLKVEIRRGICGSTLSREYFE